MSNRPKMMIYSLKRWLQNHQAAPTMGGLALGILLILLLTLAGCSNEGQALEADNDKKSEKSEKKDGDEDTKEEELPPVEVVSLTRGSIEAVFALLDQPRGRKRGSGVLPGRPPAHRAAGGGKAIASAKARFWCDCKTTEQRSELARIESQLNKARREYQRQQNLFAKELISEQMMNDATYEVEQLEIALGDAQRNLGYTEVKAPIAGTVTGRHVNRGDHITINQHLFDMVDFDTIEARVYVPEKELKRLRIGQEARVFSDSIGGEARVGEVSRIAPIVDPKSGTVKVTVGIPGNQGLLPGMYVEVELVTDTRDDALLVPKRAVLYDQNQASLYRLRDDMTAERLRIEVVLEDRTNILPGSLGRPVFRRKWPGSGRPHRRSRSGRPQGRRQSKIGWPGQIWCDRGRRDRGRRDCRRRDCRRRDRGRRSRVR